MISHGPSLPIHTEFSSYAFLQISVLQSFIKYNAIGCFYNHRTSLAVFPHALLPWVAYATFHTISDTVFVQAGGTAAPRTLGT